MSRFYGSVCIKPRNFATEMIIKMESNIVNH